jgi:hypothetical protein
MKIKEIFFISGAHLASEVRPSRFLPAVSFPKDQRLYPLDRTTGVVYHLPTGIVDGRDVLCPTHSGSIVCGNEGKGYCLLHTRHAHFFGFSRLPWPLRGSFCRPLDFLGQILGMEDAIRCIGRLLFPRLPFFPRRVWFLLSRNFNLLSHEEDAFLEHWGHFLGIRVAGPRWALIFLCPP